MRVANLPSVVSNVWLGVFVGTLLMSITEDESSPFLFPWTSAIAVAAAGSLLYVAGNFLNDWIDRDWDARYRPERALPLGMFRPVLYLVAGILASAVAWGLASWVNDAAFVVSVLISISIWIYTATHKKTAEAVLFVALCRSLLVVLGCVGVMSPPVDAGGWIAVFLPGLVVSIPLFCYIVGISLTARYESKKLVATWPRVVSVVLLFVPPLLVMGAFVMSKFAAFGLAGVSPYVGWILFCRLRLMRSVSTYVSGLLAGIPLVDTMFVVPCIFMAVFVGDAVTIEELALFTVAPLAFVAGLLLQRLAPAT
ncbi:MAG: UbiA family prenyltransferase [Akkermansiaceae bacterium]|nr:UbiA family prenyltransferase [Akkermansiaceae bacterium]